MIRNLLLNQENWYKTAIYDGSLTYNYKDIANKAIAIRLELTEKEGTNAALLLPDGSDFIAALFGILMAGFTVIPINPKIKKFELEALFSKIEIHIVIYSGHLDSCMLTEISHSINHLEHIDIDRIISWDGHELPPPVMTDPDLPMVLLNTSGTTEQAKIVMLSERNLDSCVSDYLDRFADGNKIGIGCRFLLGTPFYTVYGLLILAAIARSGTALIRPHGYFTSELFFKTIAQYRVTHYEGGAIAAALMEQSIGRTMPFDISSLQYVCFGGSAVSCTTMKKLSEAFPHACFWPGYGMTEAAVIAKPNQHFPKEKFGSVGIAGNNTKLGILAEGLRSQLPFVKGEIVVKSPGVMLGYYQNPHDTGQILRDGWLYTGDVGYLDADGYLYICGRIRNMILVRGFTVYAEEVENCLLNSHLVSNCVVYGVKDTFGSEQVQADVVPQTADIRTEDIMEWCGRHLSDYKQPRQIHLIEHINRTGNGKISRKREGSS